MDKKTINEVKKLKEEGLSLREIANKVNVGKSSVSRILSQDEDNNLSQDSLVPENVVPKNTVPDNIVPRSQDETDVPIYTETETVPDDCPEWIRHFTTNTYYPKGTKKHYIKRGNVGIEKGYENLNKDDKTFITSVDIW